MPWVTSWAERLVRLVETSTFRHASLTAFVFLLMTFASILASSRQIDHLLMNHVRGMILADIQEHRRRADFQDTSALLDALTHSPPHRNEGNVTLVLSVNDEVLFGERYLQQAMVLNSTPRGQWFDSLIEGPDGDSMRMLGMHVQLADGGVFLSAFNILPMLQRLRVIPIVAGSGLLAVLLSSLAIGLYSSLRSMRRVDRIRSALRAYIDGNREVSVPTSPNGDEFDLLSTDINLVLSRINLLMDDVKSISSHLAHELRTPLTRLHNQLMETAEHADDEVRKSILGAVEEAERIQRIFKAVLRIGEIEAGQCAHSFEWFDARKLLCDIVDYYQPMAESDGITLRIDAANGRNLLGDRALLFQALANLLENAMKYSGQGACISVLARQTDTGTEIGVADDGPGIPADLRGEAVKRFRRLHGKGQSGRGLGLALVNAIANLHSGALVLEGNPPRGLLAVLRLRRNHWSETSGERLIGALRG